MKDVWVVETEMMNGTMTMGSVVDVFTDETMARDAAEKLKVLNKDCKFPVRVTVKESTLFEPGDEVFSEEP